MYKLKDVSFHYRASTPVQRTDEADTPGDGVTIDELKVSETGITAIIGPSGSGKTTLLSILAGFIRPTIAPSGHMSFADTPFWPETTRKARIAFVFQSHLLLGAGSALLNALQGRVAAGRPMDDADGERLTHALRKLDLSGQNPPLTAKRSRQLSGGQAQRTAILRALMADPDVILCDEPTSSLDETNADLAMEAIQDWSNKMKRPVIWVTHNIEQAAAYAQHYMFVCKGRLYRPEAATLAALHAARGAERVDILRGIANDLKVLNDAEVTRHADTGSDEGQAKNLFANISVSRGTYASWIARALSEDGTRGAVLSDETSLPQPLYDLYSRVEPHARPRPGLLSRVFSSLRSYSRYGLAMVLSAILFQVLAAGFLGDTAQVYSEQELQDPAVARIVFENDISGFGDGRNAPLIFPDALQAEQDGVITVPDLVERMRTAVERAAPESDLDRIAVFGRRALEGQRSSLALVNAGDAAPAGCARAIEIDTVVFDEADPILQQARLQPDARGGSMTLADALERDLPAGDLGRRPARLLLGADIVAQIMANCDLPAGALPEITWSIGPNTPALSGYIVGAVQEFPPLYPIAADLIVLEEDF
jgi:ABC-type lipoprotein export system ATPase subunit